MIHSPLEAPATTGKSSHSQRIILLTIGTDGDVFPYVGLGAVLKERGHDITLLAAAPYEKLARTHGFKFDPLVSVEENDELFTHPDFWNPRKSARLCARWGARFMARQYALLSGLATPETVLVANPGLFAGQLVHEKLGAPLIHLVLQPWMIPSTLAPPIMPGFAFLRHAPAPVWTVFWAMLDLVSAALISRELNGLRASLGLRPVRRIFKHWLSRQLVLGLFPDWYGPPQSDWPPQIRLTGFPLFDGVANAQLPPDVAAFCDSGTAPLAFTFGTGMAHPGEHFRAALGACSLLGRRAIFLTKFRDQLPEVLPPNILHCRFAPFRKLFPKCAAVVHHGGIGTSACAMASATPQLIHPLCFDQLDNGFRIRGLGVGDWLPPRARHPARLVEGLTKVLSPQIAANCNAIATRLRDARALESTADLIIVASR